ncbi:tRNA (adenosine(37)-N6)-threonylcarbamoyltransferase complex ATPase subunit type 1 TsaE [Marinomonas sp. 2405UD68-3]|uniref:tRNA (adenosine(37)-N6)-threonylcarbamoyltransferase complex ATPase subunit type 1 TsaE n=1 Tax=Marinomonas sp. 2405UD68-3 TaxID=3391835 RepID=UPI0039C90384
MSIECEIYGEEAMELLGQRLAPAFLGLKSVHFQGDLGMGKTTLVRGVLKGLDYIGPVKSPTYTLVEPYEVELITVYHFDLYRLMDAEELEYMGIRDYFQDESLCLIEWPDKGEGVLPEADLIVSLTRRKQGRLISLESITSAGEKALDKFRCL